MGDYRIATKDEIEEAFYGNDFCEGCARWRDDANAKTQCNIAGHASAGENYKNYWRTANGKTFCSKRVERGQRIKKQVKTELMELMENQRL